MSVNPVADEMEPLVKAGLLLAHRERKETQRGNDHLGTRQGDSSVRRHGRAFDGHGPKTGA